MLRITGDHTPLLGKLAKITWLGVLLAKEYEELFKTGNSYTAERSYHYCQRKDEYELWLMFIDEAPITHHNMTWYCLKEIGKGVNGDYYWYTLDQLMICDNAEPS